MFVYQRVSSVFSVEVKWGHEPSPHKAKKIRVESFMVGCETLKFTGHAVRVKSCKILPEKPRFSHILPKNPLENNVLTTLVCIIYLRIF
jgi:hypothetical protein